MRLHSISTLTLSKSTDFIVGLEAAARGDISGAAEKFRFLVHMAPHLLPAIITPLLRLTTQSDHAKNIQLLAADLFAICGWYTEAIQELEEVLEIDPDETAAYQLLGKIWSRAPRHTEIEAIFEMAIENNVFDSAILDILPKMYIGQFEFEKSVALYQKLVDREPNAIHFQFALANLLAKCQRFDCAIQTFEQIVEKSPLHAADVAFRLEELVSVAPDNIRLRETLFWTNCKICKPDVAVSHLSAMLDWHPDQSVHVTDLLMQGKELFPNSAIIYLTLARALVLSQQYSEAIGHLQRLFNHPEKEYLFEITEIATHILTLYPAQVFAMQLLSDISVFLDNYNEALDYLEQMSQFDLEEADPVEQRLSQIGKSSSVHLNRCHHIRAKLLLQQRHLDQAIVECQMLNGTELAISAQQITATAYELKHDFEKSESTLHSALTQSPNNPEIHGQLKGLKQRYTERLITDHGDNPEPCLSLGIAYLIQGDYYLALEQLQKINPSHADHSTAQLLVSRCFLDLGRYDQSLNHLNRLISNDTTADATTANQARYLASTNYLSLGDINRCIETLESILEFDITFGDVHPLLKLLKQESVIAYRVKAVSGYYNSSQQLILTSVRNTEIATNQTMSFAHPHNNAGVDYLFKHQLKAAEDEFRLALQMDPNLTVIYCNFAILKLLQRQVDEAITLIKTAEGINPHFDLIHLLRGLIATSENRLRDAEQQFQSAYALRADHYITLLNLGDIYYQQHDLEPAFEFWKNAAQLVPIPHLIQRRLGYLIPVAQYWTRWSNGIEIPILFPNHPK